MIPSALRTDPPAKPDRAFRVGHTGDLHLTSGPRFKDTTKVLDHIVEDGRRHEVDAWLIGSDLTGTHDVPHVATTEERSYLADLFQRMAQTAPVLIELGNHDVADDIALYRRMKGPNPIEVAIHPGVYSLNGGQVDVFALPFPYIGNFVNAPASRDQTIKADNEAASALVRGLLEEWAPAAEKARIEKRPTLLFAHLNVIGARTSGDEILCGKEVELAAADLDGFPADYVALSHIHLHQQMAERAWYAGSPSSQTFGEPDEKGYLIVDVFSGETPHVYRRLTPARRMVTVDATWVQVGGTWQWLGSPEDEIASLPAGAEVKIRVQVPEDAATSCPVDELAGKYAEAGFHVARPERRIVPKVRIRSEEIQAAQSNSDKLKAFWMSVANPPKDAQQERCLEKLIDLERELAGDAPESLEREERAA